MLLYGNEKFLENAEDPNIHFWVWDRILIAVVPPVSNSRDMARPRKNALRSWQNGSILHCWRDKLFNYKSGLGDRSIVVQAIVSQTTPA